MKKMIKGFILLAIILLLFTGCVSYSGPDGYVPFNTNEPIASSTQSANLFKGDLTTTYDDEFVYDAEGRMIKHRQTEYFNSTAKDQNFVIWETEYQVVGGVVLPYRVMVNDVVYIEIDYKLLSTDATGPVKQTTKSRSLTETVKEGFFKSYNIHRGFNLSDYPVDFESDGDFIVKEWVYNRYRGYLKKSILTLGKDNIVLTHYSYSYEKFFEGFKKSYAGGVPFYIRNRESVYDGNNFTFDYEWDVINGKICQKKMEFIRNSDFYNIAFIAEMEYNEAGNQTHETWSSSKSPEEEKEIVFESSFEY